jgi:hypothetical protein
MDQQRLRELVVLQLGDQVLRLIELTAEVEALRKQLAEKVSAETPE